LRATRRIDELRQAQKETVGLAKGGQPYQASTGVENTPVEVPTLASLALAPNAKTNASSALDHCSGLQPSSKEETAWRGGLFRIPLVYNSGE
jgi:hypothetical protein